MDSRKIPNGQFLKDLILDIDNIYNYYISDPTQDRLESIFTQFSLDCIANPVHLQSCDFVNTFFISLLNCIYESTANNDFHMFVVLIYMMKSIFFNQIKNIIRIPINLEGLVMINEFIENLFLGEKDKNLLNYCVDCLDSIKRCCGFNVFIDKDGFSLSPEDTSMILNEISKFEEDLDELENNLK